MTDFDASTYGDRIAAEYDSIYRRYDPAAIDLLAELAGDGPALELGIGTGRLALPLSRRGVSVRGVDASTAMIDQLRAKPGGADIPVTIADFTELNLAERFSLVYIVFNTFFSLANQEAQVRCFPSVAEHLTDEGVFLIEAFVPDPTRFDRDQRVSVSEIESRQITLEVSRHDPLGQRVDAQLLRISEQGVGLFPVRLRYAWPSELDLMARLAGLSLRERWGGWDRSELTARSDSHVSVYGRDL